MSVKFYLPALLLVCFACSNNGQGSKQLVSQQDSLDFIREFLENPANLDTVYQRVDKEVPPIIDKFHQLIEDEKYEEAIALYESKKGDIMAFQKTTTEKYEFDKSVKHLYFNLYDENEALQKIIELCEFEETLADFVIETADNGFVPTHYAKLLNEIAELYYIAENNDKALEKLEKLGNFVVATEGKENTDYAAILFNMALLYETTDKSEQAIQKLRDAQIIYEKIGMRDSKEWQNCVDIINKFTVDNF
ncbi:MAG: tetratricopeptide repeat protein [Tannerella sp.]|jgi:tetratricopeptide (TPR) repeat protein|nr:tetratricopeptide repeat protein [Tannerella sp.]